MKQPALAIAFLTLAHVASAQSPDSTAAQPRVSGAATVTNNGISLIPTFTLGKPAAIFDVAVRKRRFSFEPQLAFALAEARPWYFVFWLRYQAVQTPRFNLRVGVHPAFAFSTQQLTQNGITGEYTTTARFFVGEVAPTYTLSKHLQVGLYYLHAHGVGGAPTTTYLLGLPLTYATPLGRLLRLRVTAQPYYLKLAENGGYYVTSSVSLVKNRFPLSVAAVINKKLSSTVPSDDFLWNVSLSYSY